MLQGVWIAVLLLVAQLLVRVHGIDLAADTSAVHSRMACMPHHLCVNCVEDR
jgi:uncharacterized membrane protein